MSRTDPSTLRRVLEAPGTAHGGWCAILDSVGAEIIASAGFDWCCVDLQHGAGAQDALVPMLQGIDAAGVPPIVRVPWNEPWAIMRVLDAGAHGVIVPMVDSPQQAEAAARACRFAPEGARSWGPARAALAGGFTPAQANSNVVCLPMVESATAVDAVDEILAVDGVDGVFVGPSDLSVTLGIAPSDSHEAKVQDAIAQVLDACRRAGRIAGVFAADEASIERYTTAGFDMVAVMNDMRLLGRAAADALARARSWSSSA